MKKYIFPINQDEEVTKQYSGKAIMMFRDCEEYRYHFLSNMYPCKVILPANGDLPEMEFNSVEQAYMASKVTDVKVREHIAALSPKDANMFSRTDDFPLREDFTEEYKLEIMRNLVAQKFSDENPELNQKLINTDNSVLVEGNYWNDDYWGFDLKAGYGQNHLGRILMEVRKNIISK